MSPDIVLIPLYIAIYFKMWLDVNGGTFNEIHRSSCDVFGDVGWIGPTTSVQPKSKDDPTGAVCGKPAFPSSSDGDGGEASIPRNK